MSLYYDEVHETRFHEALETICDERLKLESKKLPPTLSEYEKVMGVILKYIKENKRVIYGGYAQHLLLIAKDPKQGIYRDIDRPDAEFYTPDLKGDVVNLCNELHAMGFPDVVAQDAQHESTFKIFVDYEGYCDITYRPQRVIDSIPVVPVSGYLCASPVFMYTDVFRTFAYPLDNFYRLTKTYKRAGMLIRDYPFHFKDVPRFQLKKFSYPEKNEVLKIVRDLGLVLGEIEAHNMYMRKAGMGKKAEITVPYIVCTSSSFQEDTIEIMKRLQQKHSGVMREDYEGFLDLYGQRADFFVQKNDKKKVLLQVYDEKRCVSYVTIEGTRYLSIQALAFYLLAVYQKMMCDAISKQTPDPKLNDKMVIRRQMMNNLVEAKKTYFRANPSKTPVTKGIPFQEFIVECVGVSYPERRAHRDRIKARKKAKMPYVFKYDPALPNSRKGLDFLKLRLPLGNKLPLKDVRAQGNYDEEKLERPVRERGDNESVTP